MIGDVQPIEGSCRGVEADVRKMQAMPNILEH
jgi:hypothetical protein